MIFPGALRTLLLAIVAATAVSAKVFNPSGEPPLCLRTPSRVHGLTWLVLAADCPYAMAAAPTAGIPYLYGPRSGPPAS